MSAVISDAYADKVRPVLNLIDDLRKIGVQKCVPIPQIAVMGDQSSGKSSVLEAISGIAFPRSAGPCTRCPTQVTMTHGEKWSATLQAGRGKTFELGPGEESRIPTLIESLTTQLAGKPDDGGFSAYDEYIEISLVSPNVPDLTIIDLPGIVRTTTKGQSDTVKSQVDGMLERYLEQERTIILAVIPSNVDIATVDILERASKADPEGSRTIGVLTNPDLVDKGAESEIIEVLANRAKPLQHGYYMVKNRSQKELNTNESPAVALERESDWLLNSAYAHIPGVSKTRLGVKSLTSALTELLVSRIEESLPDIAVEIENVLKKTKKDLANLGRPPPCTTGECRTLASEIIAQFLSKLRRSLTDPVPIVDHNGVKYPGILQKERQLRKIFVSDIMRTRPGFDGEHDEFEVKVTDGGTIKKEGEFVKNVARKENEPESAIGEKIEVSEKRFGFQWGQIASYSKYFRGDLAKCMEEQKGRELPGFMSFSVFQNLMAEYVELWHEPTEKFHSEICSAVKKAAIINMNIATKEWPRLEIVIIAKVSEYFEQVEMLTMKRLQEILSLEKICLTENRNFSLEVNRLREKRMRKKLEYFVQKTNRNTLKVDEAIDQLRSSIGTKSNESQELCDMTDLLKSYWDLAHMRYIDGAGMIVTDSYTGSQQIDKIEKRLTKTINSINDDGLLKLFTGIDRREERRAELKAIISNMECARQRLREGV